MGFFLTVEGCEGAGKTSAISYIGAWFDDQGFSYEQTREPGGTKMAEAIRKLLLADYSEKVTDMTELLLMFAARCQNLYEKIKPTIAEGKVLLCDRFTDATYAYQGGGRGVDLESIAILENLVQGSFRPDLTILLDVDPKIGLERVQLRGKKLDRIEQEDITFFERVRSSYLARARLFPERYAVINSNGYIQDVRSQIKQVLERRVKLK